MTRRNYKCRIIPKSKVHGTVLPLVATPTKKGYLHKRRHKNIKFFVINQYIIEDKKKSSACINLIKHTQINSKNVQMMNKDGNRYPWMQFLNKYTN